MEKTKLIHIDYMGCLLDEPIEINIVNHTCANCYVPHNKYTGCSKLNGLVTPDNFYCVFWEKISN